MESRHIMLPRGLVGNWLKALASRQPGGAVAWRKTALFTPARPLCAQHARLRPAPAICPKPLSPLLLRSGGHGFGSGDRRSPRSFSSGGAEQQTNAVVPAEVALLQALDLESRHGYCNLKGKRYASFHLFLLAQLEDFAPAARQHAQLGSWRDALEHQTSRYPGMEAAERQRTLADVRRFLDRFWQLKAEGGMAEPAAAEPREPAASGYTERPRPEPRHGERRPESSVGQSSQAQRADPSDAHPTSSSLDLVFLDLETTGLSAERDRVVEVALFAPKTGLRWTRLVDPERPIPYRAREVTGLTDDIIAASGCGNFASIAEDLVSFVKEAVESGARAPTLVAHNARFDARFLAAEFTRCGAELPESWRFYDSLELARGVLGKGPNAPRSFGLQSLNQHFGLPEPSREHRAMDDVDVLARVFGRLVSGMAPGALERAVNVGAFGARAAAGGTARPTAEARRRRERSLRPGPSGARLPDHLGGGRDPLSRGPAPPLAPASPPPPPLSGDLEAGEAEFLTNGVPLDTLTSFTPLQRQFNAEAGFSTLASLLQHYPRDYLHYSGDWNDEEFICSQGVVSRVKSFCKGAKGFIECCVCCDGGNEVTIKQWYHFRNYRLAQRALKGMEARFPVDSIVGFKGKLKRRPRGGWDLTGTGVEMTPLDDFVQIEKQIIAVYPARGPIKSGAFNKLIRKALSVCPVVDLLPRDVTREHGLLGHREALEGIHFPSTLEHADRARRSLVFQELFLLQTALMLRRHQLQTPKNNVDAKGIKVGESRLLGHATSRLPYNLTQAQGRVLGEVIGDMTNPPPMMRLLQGDVGSGKTIVALLAMLSVVDAGYQAAFMVPTEILATQQAAKLEEFLGSLGLEEAGFEVPRVVVLTGSMRAAQKREAMEATASGAASITFGTHSLISEGVKFLKLGLAVIDEQHKFGVEQRSKLQSKNQPPPHLLSMSATPIPRTLALTMYGEMALSYIDESPPGRHRVETTVTRQDDARGRAEAYSKLVREVQAGNKGFVVFPLIDASESEDFASIRAAEDSFRDLLENELSGVPCGLLHGRLPPEEKLQAQRDFVEGRTRVLVATAVIEVGVDIPEATCLIVENSERFGLAQLHQLRGRVGRSDRRSHCYLLTGGAESSHQRIKKMETLDNGFQVSEMDMALRGPGEFIGTRQAGQSGLGALKIADISRESDRETLEEARAAAARAFGDGEPKLGKELLLYLQNQSPVPYLDVAPDLSFHEE